MRDVVKDDINLTRIVDLPPSASPIPNIFGNPPFPRLWARKLPPQQPRKPLSAPPEAHHHPRRSRWKAHPRPRSGAEAAPDCAALPERDPARQYNSVQKEKKKNAFAPAHSLGIFFFLFLLQRGAATSLPRALFFAPTAQKTPQPSRAYSPQKQSRCIWSGVVAGGRRLRAGRGLSTFAANPAPHPQPPRCRAFPPPLFCRRRPPPTKQKDRQRGAVGGGFRSAARTGVGFHRLRRGWGGLPAVPKVAYGAAAGGVSAPKGAEAGDFQRCSESGKRRGVGLRFG